MTKFAYKPGLRKRLALRETKFKIPSAKVVGSSWPNYLSAISQAGLLLLAIYGLFISDAGDRLFEMLRSDIEESKKSLEATAGEKRLVEAQLSDQKSQLELAMRESAKAQLDAARGENSLKTVSDELEISEQKLRSNLDEISSLENAVAITRPVVQQQRCRAIFSALQAGASLEMRTQIFPIFRWYSFSSGSNVKKMDDWNKLISAYKSWTQKEYSSDRFIEKTFKTVDDFLLGQMSDQLHWSRFNTERENEILKQLKISEPSKFVPRISENPRQYARNMNSLDGLYSFKSIWERVDMLISKERLETTDKVYAAWKNRLREILKPYQARLSEPFTVISTETYKSKAASFSAANQHLRLSKNAFQARRDIGSYCYPNRTALDDLFLDL